MPSIEAAAYTAGRLIPELLHEWEGRDGQLAEAQEYLAQLEADPATDELAIVEEARQAVLQRKQTLLWRLDGEN
jgi:hypothetical protein